MTAVRLPSTLLERILVVGLAGLFAVALAELFVRYVAFPEYRAISEQVYVSHPIFRYFNRPNLAVPRFSPGNYSVINHTNSLGLRGLEANMAAELSGVWMAGDSNVFAAGVSDNEVFTARLSAFGYRAANLACEGHNASDQVAVVRYLWQLGYRPRAVVLGLSLNQAIQDYTPGLANFDRPIDVAPSAEATLVGPRGRLRQEIERLPTLLPSSFIDLRGRLIRSSALYGFLKVGVLKSDWLRDRLKQAGLVASLDVTVQNRLEYFLPYDRGNPTMPLLVSTVDLVSGFSQVVRRDLQVPFGVVLFPHFHQMYPDGFSRFLARAGLEGRQMDPFQPLKALKSGLEARGIPVLDLLPVLKASGVEPLTFPDDGHLNAPAHAVVAEAVARWLGEHLLVPPQR